MRARVLMFFVFLAFVSSAFGQVTSLTLNSDPGDYVGGGQFTFFTPSDGSFSASQISVQGAISISFIGQAGDFWYLSFAAPENQLLTLGTYTGATRFPFQNPGQPGLDVNGDGRGCNTLTGDFQVLEISYGSGSTIDSFDAIFDQHCDGAVPALHGEIRFNAHPAVSLTAPSHFTAQVNENTSFTVSATDILSGHVALSVSGLPTGASFNDNGNNTGTFSWTPTDSQVGSYLLTFQGDNLSGNTGVTFTYISVIPPPPSNDDFSNAYVIPSIPFSGTEDVTNATIAPDDPWCYGRNQTVWGSFTPSVSMSLEANTFGSNYDTTLSVYTGTRGALAQIGCNDDSNYTAQSRVRFDAVAGTTYYFMVSSLHPVSPATMVFNLLQAPPPLSMAPSVTQFGSVDPTTGTATISGFVACSQPSYVSIFGELKQMHAGTPISGFFSAFVACTGTTPWSASMQTVPALFHGRSVALFTGGKANVSASATAYDPDTGEVIQRDFSATVILKGNGN